MAPAQKRMPAEERKALTLEAALNVFARRGYSGARTKEIAREAGISETLMFRHFGNKENLFRQALVHLFSTHPIMDALGPALAAQDDREVLVVLASHIMEHCRDDERIVRLALFSALEGMGRSRQESIALEALESYLSRRMEAGVFRRLDAGLVARFFLYAVFMFASDLNMGLTGPSSAIDVDRAAEVLADVFLGGLLPRP